MPGLHICRQPVDQRLDIRFQMAPFQRHNTDNIMILLKQLKKSKNPPIKYFFGEYDCNEHINGKKVLGKVEQNH